MLILLHKNAATTPATRRAIQQASGTDAELAAQFGVGRLTIRKWRKRGTTEDGSHTPHRLQITLNAGQEEVVVYLRTQLRLSLDDLLAAVREFIEPAMSRSALDRLLRRRGINRLPEPEVTPTQVKSFKAYEPGYVHMDVKYLPQMQDETTRRYVVVAIDRAHALGVHRHQEPQDGGQCTGVSQRAEQGCTVQDHHAAQRQRPRVHRPSFWPAREGRQRRGRVRRPVRSAGNRAPADPAQASSDQRHGRALQ